MKINKKFTIIIGSCVLAVGLIAGITYSLFSDNSILAKDFGTGKVDFSYKVDTVDGEYFIDITNNSSIDAYLRMRLTPSLTVNNEEFGDSDVALGNVSDDSCLINIADETLDDWVLVDDGYYYYKKVIKPTDKTLQFKINFISYTDVPKIYAGYDFHSNLYTNIEAIQASNEAYKLSWDMESLPEEMSE